VLSVEAKSPTGPEELLKLLLSKLPADGNVWSSLRGRFHLQLSFGIFVERLHGGFYLSPAALSRIDSLGAGMDVGIYANLENDTDG
jgi:hypothetical protein